MYIIIHPTVRIYMCVSVDLKLHVYVHAQITIHNAFVLILLAPPVKMVWSWACVLRKRIE